ncbi:MAG: heavy-metal-associated domain-containing protein [Treponema sp.]
MNSTTVIKIEGMSCKHCVAHVEKALQALNGVSATVSLEEKQATITHPDGVALSTLKQAIIDAGYTPVEG